MMKKLIFGIIGLILVVLVVVRVVQASGEQELPPDVEEIRRQSGIPVEVASAQTGPLVVTREFTGTIRGIRSATIRARTGDEIVEIPVRVGQRVAAGAILIRQSQEGSMASVRQAEAAYDQASRSVERLRPLREQGAISEQDWDNATTALSVAEANLAAAMRAVDLTSPISGVVTDVMETRGSVPSPGDPLVRVSDLSRIQVLLQVSTSQSRELAIGQQAVLPDYQITGQVTRIALQADPETRLLEVELTFPGSAGSTGRSVVPGGLVTASVVIGEKESALLVPRDAMNEGAVWVIDNAGIASLRPVKTGLAAADLVEILDGVTEGERVVIAGASLLSDGALARIVGG
jgi:RND family efflux transporter MFP subunit